MPNYFKDQKLLLLFCHASEGIRVDDIGGFCVDERSGKSLVIAARGGWKRTGEEFLSDEPYLGSQSSLRSIYFDLQTNLQYGDGSRAREAQENFPEEYANLFEIAEAPMTETLIILAYDDGVPIPENCPPIIAYRRGGAELVVEFLLSNFSSARIGPARNLGVVDRKSSGDAKPRDLSLEKMGFVNQGSRPAEWVYDFSLAGDFSGLDDFCELNDSDDLIFEEFERVVYGIERSRLNEMTAWISVPPKLHDLLTEEQKRIFKEEKLPQILMEELDFIGIKLFGQKFDDSRAHDGMAWLRLRGAAWDANVGYLLADEDD